MLKNPFEVERDVLAVLDLLDSKDVIRLAGDWRSEGVVYEVVSLVLARLTRKGWSKSVSGAGFGYGRPLAPADVHAAVLLQAPCYESNAKDVRRDRPPGGEPNTAPGHVVRGSKLEEAGWLTPAHGRVRILVGELSEWERIGERPDYVVAIPDSAEEKLGLVRALIVATAQSPGPGIRAALLANVCGLDWPIELLFEDYQTCHLNLPFAAVEDAASCRPLGVVCGVWGLWLPAQVLLRDFPEAIPKLLDAWSVFAERVPETVASRVTRRLAGLPGLA